MWLLILGWVLFLSAHLTPGVLGKREQLVNTLGEKRFLGLYIGTSVTGMVCIISGKSIAPFINVWYPPVWGMEVAGILVLLGCVFVSALLLPTNLRRLLHHPMLWGIASWGIGHLFANGDLASMLLFGGFASFALLSIWSLNRRGKHGDQTKYAASQDLLAAVAGIVAYAALFWLHPILFGVAITR